MSGLDLHLWKIECGAAGAALNGQWSLLSGAERTRAGRFHQECHRNRYARAHAGLRRVLSRYINVRPQDIVFQHGSAGKPDLTAKNGRLQFNLTTSVDLALVAVCREYPVGVDCEQIRLDRSLIAIAQRMFRPEDAQEVAAAPEDERPTTFCRFWTALEASVKADGRGLFRSRDQSTMPSLDVGHCVPAEGFIAAVARTALPPAETWGLFSLDRQEPSNKPESRF